MTDLQEAPKEIDWERVKSLYFHGVTPTEIAKQTGVRLNTISVMASRKGWPALLRQAREGSKAVTITVQQPEAESPKLTAQSERTRRALADVLTRSAEELASAPIRNAKHALIVNQEAESMVRNAKTVFGWSEGQSQPSVRINVMANAVSITECEQSKVIDVTSESVQLDSESSASDSKPQ